MGKNDPLPEKYRKALSLIKEGNLSYRDIAKACDINESNFYDLIEGTSDNLGTVGEKFKKEFDEIQKQIDRDIIHLVKKNKKTAQRIVDRYLTEVENEKTVDKKMLSVVGVVNALAKSTPGVHIGSFVYQKGLSAEDIYGEFKRLTGLALDRGSVQGSSEGGTGEVPVAPGPGTATPEE